MENVTVLMVLAGLLGLVVGAVWLIYSFIRKKDKRTPAIVLGVAALCVVVGALAMPIDEDSASGAEVNSSEQNSTEVEDADYSLDSEEEEKALEEVKEEEKEDEDPSTYETDITYDNLARDPDKYEDEKVKFSGRIIQVMEDDEEDYTQYRFAVNDDSDTVAYLAITKDQLDSRILEDDMLTIYGKSIGVVTYESTLSGDVTIPAIIVNMFEQN